MPFALKLPRRNPDAPRPSLRERAAALKASAAKVIGKKPGRLTPPKPVGAGEPSPGLAAVLAAHEQAYGYALYAEAYGLPDLAERRQAEEEAFRALLHSPLRSDADRAAYAAAVISRQGHRLGDDSATKRDHPLAVAYRNLALGEYAREPEALRHVGRPAEPDAADPILAAIAASKAATAAFDAIEAELAGRPMTPDLRDREDAISSADLDALKAVWKTVPTTPAGRRALVEFARFRLARVTHSDGRVDDPEYWFGLILDAFAAMVADPSGAWPARASADPVLTAIEAHRAAHAVWHPLMCAWSDTLGGTPEYEAAQAADAAARPIERAAFRTLLATRPTTAAGCVALTAYLSGMIVETDHHLDEDMAEVLRALRDGAAPFAAEPATTAQPAPDLQACARLSAEQIDLTKLDVYQLSALFEAYKVARFSWEGVAARPYSHDDDRKSFFYPTKLGEAANFEEERAGRIVDRITREIKSRTPADEAERNEILMSRTRHELMCNGRIHDNALLLDITRAWIV